MTNARIKDIGNDLKSEAIATDIHLRYDPVSGNVQVDFHFQDFVTNAAGIPVGNFTTGMYDLISVSMSKLGPTKVGTGLKDPVSNVPLDWLTGYGVMACIKQQADAVYNERADMAPSPNPILPP